MSFDYKGSELDAQPLKVDRNGGVGTNVAAAQPVRASKKGVVSW